MEQQPKQDSDYQTELKHRIRAALFLIPIALAVIYIGAPISVLLGIIIVIGLLVEWIRLTVAPFDSKPHFTLILLIFGFVYIGISGFWMIGLLTEEGSWSIVYTLLLTIWATDSGAFFVGKKLGGKKLAPSISSNKTWAGFIGGMIVGTVVGCFTHTVFVIHAFPIWLIPIIVFVAQLGDLLESKVKRVAGVKDSSSLIPGHGGILDRLDSLLAVAFFMAIWQGF